jgi:hypothetical protein
MKRTLMAQVKELARVRHQQEQKVMDDAVIIGVKFLYRESVLARYLKKRLSRRRAVQAVGLESVKLAEAQNAAVLEDIAWAFGR